jgi:regulator of protease activity HflC (stomatin/prohibitin superfamily)
MELILACAAATAIVAFASMLRIVPEGEARVIERFGRHRRVLKSGLHLVAPLVERCSFRASLMEDSIDVPPVLCLTKDQAHVLVNGIIFYKIVDPIKARYAVEDFRLAARCEAASSLRSEIANIALNEAFGARRSMNARVLGSMLELAKEWGIAITRFEILDTVPSESACQSMERKLVAASEKNVAVIESEGARIARVNLSLAEREEAIQAGLGEKARLSSEAAGRAKAMDLISAASAESIRIVASALTVTSSSEAARFELSREYIEKLASILTESNATVLPEDLAKIAGIAAPFEGRIGV